MKPIQKILDKIKSKKTGSDLLVDIIGSRISTSEEGFVLGRCLAEQSSENASEVLDSLINIRKRCSNYLHAYETDRLCYGRSTARRNSERVFRREAGKLMGYIDRIHSRIVNIKYTAVA